MTTRKILSFISPGLTSPAAAQFYPAKSVRAGYSPGCCKRLQLQPLPQNPFTKLIFCFDTLEEAHQWTEAFQWCQQAREILDEADAAAAAALEVPVPRKVCWCHVKNRVVCHCFDRYDVFVFFLKCARQEETQSRTLAAIDSLPELLPDLDNVADLTPPPPRPNRSNSPRDLSPPPPPPVPPPQPSPPPPPLPPPPSEQKAKPRFASQLPPGFVMLDISSLNLPAIDGSD